MTRVHPEARVYIGSRWEFHGTLFEVNGAKMNLTTKTLEWALLDKLRVPKLNEPGDVTITKLDAVNGQISIVVPKARNVDLPPGRYTDYLRVNGEDILWTGQIVAESSPFTD